MTMISYFLLTSHINAPPPFFIRPLQTRPDQVFSFFPSLLLFYSSIPSSSMPVYKQNTLQSHHIHIHTRLATLHKQQNNPLSLSISFCRLSLLPILILLFILYPFSHFPSRLCCFCIVHLLQPADQKNYFPLKSYRVHQSHISNHKTHPGSFFIVFFFIFYLGCRFSSLYSGKNLNRLL